MGCAMPRGSQQETRRRERLMAVALGEAAPDLAITGGMIVNVLSGDIHPGDILIRDGHIAAIRDPGDPPLPAGTPVIDATGRWLAPGLIDPHMHMESSAVSPAEFCRAVVPRGVTAIAMDPHEFGNVVGIEGIRALLDAARDLPLRSYLRVPARVPELAEELETPGATITAEQTSDMLAWPEAVCLAGDINPEIILRREASQMGRMAATAAAGKVVSGYVPQFGSPQVDAMVAAGVGDSHVPKTIEELILDIRHGLHVLLTPRPGRFEAKEFSQLADLVKTSKLDARRISLCTDDVLVHELLQDGHIDSRLRLALSTGMPPVTAIQMATRNTAELLQLDHKLGALAPGLVADIVILSDLALFTVERVLVEGRLVAEQGRYIPPREAAPLPDFVRQTVHCKVPAKPEALAIAAKGSHARCRVLQHTHPKSIAERVLPVRDGLIQPDVAADILSVAVLERYHGTGRVGRGFVEGMGLRHGAIASSVNHNCHHIFAIGTNYADMHAALARVIALQGGYVATRDGSVVGEVHFPVIGMISDHPLEALAGEMTEFERVLTEDLGCEVGRRPLYVLNFICSPVVPNYGMTDRGLVDSRALSLIDVVLPEVEAAE